MNLRRLFFVKIVAIYALLVCKTFGLKIGSCKFFDKFQVCFQGLLNAVTFPSMNPMTTRWLSLTILAHLELRRAKS